MFPQKHWVTAMHQISIGFCPTLGYFQEVVKEAEAYRIVSRNTDTLHKYLHRSHSSCSAMKLRRHQVYASLGLCFH
jgi:hypothetical protein